MFVTVILPAFLVHLLIAYRLTRASPSRKFKRGVWAGLTLLFALTAATPLSWYFNGWPVAEANLPFFVWPSYVAMGLYSLILLVWLIREFGWLTARLLTALQSRLTTKSFLPEDPARRQAMAHALNLGVLGTSGALAGVGAYEARRRARVLRVEVPIDGLPKSLDGFTIAQLSDVHVGPTIRRDYLEPIVEAVNELEPDLVAITGDLVDGSVPFLSEHVAPLGNLQSRHGTYFCTGNHEYYAGADAWVAHLPTLGVKPLMNARAELDHDGGRVIVGGCTDKWGRTAGPAHVTNIAGCLEGAPEADVRILLAHRPDAIFEAAEAGFDLQLSGHTHGGQFVPWNLVVRLVHPFSAGLDRFKDTWIYVNRGTGYFGPPVRLAVPSEITQIVLRPA